MSPLQRLHPMFPNGSPEKGLFVLRVAGGLPVLWDAFLAVIGTPHRESLLLLTFAALAGVLLMVGLWTPVAGICISVAELCLIFGVWRGSCARLPLAVRNGSFNRDARGRSVVDRFATVWQAEARLDGP